MQNDATLRCAPLTRREPELLILAVGGHTTPGLTAELPVTQATVKRHFEHIRQAWRI